MLINNVMNYFISLYYLCRFKLEVPKYIREWLEEEDWTFITAPIQVTEDSLIGAHYLKLFYRSRQKWM